MSFSCMLLLASSCNKENSSTDDNSNPDGAPNINSLAISAIVPYISVVSPVGSSSAAALNLTEEGAELDSADPKKLKANMKEIFENAPTIKGCFVGMGRNQLNRVNVNCYGPSLYLSEHHPDGTWPQTDSNSWMLPSGDLGVWEGSTETEEACIAAKMNSLVGQLRDRVQEGIETVMRAGCIARVLGESLPTTAGSTLDLAEKANAALVDANITKFTFAELKISLDSVDSNGNNVYSTSVQGTGPRGKVWTKITQKRSSDSHSEGYIWTAVTPELQTGLTGLPAPGGAGNNKKHSHVASIFFVEDGTSLKYEATKSRTNNDDEISALESDKAALFDSDKRVRVAETSNPGYDHIITNMDTETGAGEIVYLWTAGSRMEEQRVMHAHVSVASDGSKTGVGYFGFGKQLGDFRTLVKAGDLPAGTSSIEKMICNWAGPGNSHTGISFAQKQTLAYDATAGVFKASESKIQYQASADCGQNGNDSSFKYASHATNTRPVDADFVVFPSFSLQDISSGDDKDNLVMPALVTLSL